MSHQGPLSTLDKLFKSIEAEEPTDDNQGTFTFDLEKQARITKTLLKLQNQIYVFANDTNNVEPNKNKSACKK